MRKVLISTRPKWCEKICHEIGKDENGKPIYEKRIEVRKTAPKDVPFKAYIYCTKDRRNLLPIEHGKVLQKVNFWENTDAYYGFGKVIGEFVCDKVDTYKFHEGLTEFNSMGLPLRIYGSYLIFVDDYESMCLSYDEVKNYGKGKTLYGWHISDLKIYDKPKELSEFCISCKTNCEDCKKPLFYDCWKEKGRIKVVTRPPQSWQYIELVGEEE